MIFMVFKSMIYIVWFKSFQPWIWWWWWWKYCI